MIWGRGSDNHSFQEVGIPTFNYWSTGKRAFYHQVEDAPDRISFLALNNVGGYAFDFIQYFANWDQQLIWPNQKEQTLMYSSAQINLNDFYIPPVWEEECLATEVFHSMALGPTKATLVQINSNCPYKDIAYWRDFCSRNGFIWGKNADDVKNAMRRKQFALIPALGFFQNPQTKVEDLPNLFDLGVKFIYIENEEVSNPALIELIKPANDLQMVFIYMNDDSIRSILPAQSRQVIIIDEVEEVLPEISPEDADNVRIALRDINYALKPVKGKNYEQIIYLDYLEYKDSDMQKTLHRLGLLQEAGFQRADLKYILGETILELMPK
jgi:hypothetical protein